MANETEKFGLPQVLIDFKTKGITAIKRSARGVVVLILKCESTDTSNKYKISDVSEIPEGVFDEASTDLIKKCLDGTPLRILVYTLPKASVQAPKNTQATLLKQLKHIRYNYIAAPTGTTQDQQDLASYIKAERNNSRKTVKAVVGSVAADFDGVINFCTEDIKVATGKNTAGKTTYKTYTPIEYTARIAGILAGLALDRSATYYKLTEVESVKVYEDLNDRIDHGELHLFDEEDGEGVKIARACNSLQTFTTDKGEEFRKIKIVEGVDMVTDDIRDTFKKYYVGKYINDYDHKMLFVAAIMVYFGQLAGNVLDSRAGNTVDIDFQFQKDYAIIKGEDVSQMTNMQIREYNTGSQIGLSGKVKFVDAMEDLKITFTM
ncbi:phage tail sheath protein [Veillonella sp.]